MKSFFIDGKFLLQGPGIEPGTKAFQGCRSTISANQEASNRQREGEIIENSKHMVSEYGNEINK